jgi:hypothetical protein
VVDIEVGCFVEAMYDRVNRGCRKVVVNVGIAAQLARLCTNSKGDAHTVANLSSPGSGGMLAYGGVDGDANDQSIR